MSWENLGCMFNLTNQENQCDISFGWKKSPLPLGPLQRLAFKALKNLKKHIFHIINILFWLNHNKKLATYRYRLIPQIFKIKEDHFWRSILKINFEDQFWWSILVINFEDQFWTSILNINFEHQFWTSILKTRIGHYLFILPNRTKMGIC